MDFQLIIDIGLFLIYCSLFTLLLAWTWKFWKLYINISYQNKLKYSLLEIKLPREINKSPEATEIFLKAVYDGGGLSPAWLKQDWIGALPAVTSLEIVSLEGVIHFYIRSESKFKSRIEAAIYSQYPNVEIIEVPDYVELLPNITRKNEKGHAFWGVDWKLSKKGGIEEYGDTDKLVNLEYSGDMYPIKTYKDWGLDKDPKEIYKHDPLTYLLEQIGSIGKGEYFCYQILIRDALKWNEIYTINKKKDKKDKKGKNEKGKKLSDLVKFEIDKYRKKWSIKEKNKSIGDDEYNNPKKMKIPDGEDEQGRPKFKEVDAVYARTVVESKNIPPQDREADSKFNTELIQRKMGKSQVIAKVRTIYVANDSSNLGTRIPMIMAILRSFNEDAYNTFGPEMSTFPGRFDYPWQDRGKKRSGFLKEYLFQDYINRSGMFKFVEGMEDRKRMFMDYVFFNKSNTFIELYYTIYNILFYPFSPTKNLSGFILNLEELATLYHFPGEVAATPSLQRIDSTKSSSPSNLPI